MNIEVRTSDVTGPAHPDNGGMSEESTRTEYSSRRQGRLRQLGRDLGLVLPGLHCSIAGFVSILVLFFLGVGTLPIWVGIWVLALSLAVASAFARLSRSRVRRWGRQVPEPVLRRRGTGALGPVRLLGDSRRWLDLVFETLIAFPMRLITFVLAVSWIAGALGGLTYWFWGIFLPPDGDGAATFWLQAVGAGDALVALSRSFFFDAVVNAVLGLIFLITAPLVIHGLALLEVLAVTSLLGPDAVGRGPTEQAERPEQAGSENADSRPAAQRRRREWSARDWGILTTTIGGIAIIAVTWPLAVMFHGIHPLFAMLVSVALGVGLVLAVLHPALGVAMSTLASTVALVLSVQELPTPWPWPVPVIVAWALTVGVASLVGRWQVPTTGIPTAGVISVLVVYLRGAGHDTSAWTNVIVTLSVGALVATIGILVGAWFRSRSALASAEQVSAEEMARRRDLEERNRIARELHDVVAHSMSVISVQATTAQYRLGGVEPPVAAEFDQIAEHSRSALGEMRSLLTILRGGAAAETAPQPLATDIPTLVETTRQAGIVVDLGIAEGALDAIAPSAGLTAYRTVQEALSNAVRHAPGSRITVTINRGPGIMGGEQRDEVTIEVDNGPRDPSFGGARPAPGAGLGLSGIRERVSALGGHLLAGPTGEGGFHVEAIIPVG
jgi:signal transduction histidine kinase